MNTTTTIRNRKSRPIGQLCKCGQRTMSYVTAEGLRNAPYCQDCAKLAS